MEGFRSTPDCQDVLIWIGRPFREKKEKPAGAELFTSTSVLMQESLGIEGHNCHGQLTHLYNFGWKKNISWMKNEHNYLESNF